MRSYLIAGNWKMNTTVPAARKLASTINDAMKSFELSSLPTIALFPPFVNIAAVIDCVDAHRISVGAQNCSEHPYGAFTGEVSIEMIESLMCQYVLIGHSERRQIFHESNELIAEKLHRVLQSNVRPILCIGESLSQRQDNLTWSVLAQQLDSAFHSLSTEQTENVIIAYEPVWAIGSGLAATPEEAQEAHAFIRAHVESMKSGQFKRLQILYGGSVNAENAHTLLRQEDIDGALIGGASLKAETFISIIQQTSTLTQG